MHWTRARAHLCSLASSRVSTVSRFCISLRVPRRCSGAADSRVRTQRNHALVHVRQAAVGLHRKTVQHVCSFDRERVHLACCGARWRHGRCARRSAPMRRDRTSTTRCCMSTTRPPELAMMHTGRHKRRAPRPRRPGEEAVGRRAHSRPRRVTTVRACRGPSSRRAGVCGCATASQRQARYSVWRSGLCFGSVQRLAGGGSLL